MSKIALKRICLALVVGATLFQTTGCTVNDLLSVYGLSALIGALATST